MEQEELTSNIKHEKVRYAFALPEVHIDNFLCFLSDSIQQ